MVTSLGIEVKQVTFPWLTNKFDPAGEGVEGRLWELFLKLGGSADGMRAKARKLICSDGYLPARNCLLEFDEIQHFTPQRLVTLDALSLDDQVGFDVEGIANFVAVSMSVRLRTRRPPAQNSKLESEDTPRVFGSQACTQN